MFAMGNENSKNKEKRRTQLNLGTAKDQINKHDIILADRHNLEVLYSNVDCLTNKMNDLKLLIFESQKNKPDIIMLTEINAKYYKYSLSENELKLPGYKLYSKNIGVKNRRGIVVYVKDNINVIECINMDTKFEEQILLEIINK